MHSDVAGQSVNWYSHLEGNLARSSKTLHARTLSPRIAQVYMFTGMVYNSEKLQIT